MSDAAEFWVMRVIGWADEVYRAASPADRADIETRIAKGELAVTVAPDGRYELCEPIESYADDGRAKEHALRLAREGKSVYKVTLVADVEPLRA